MITAERLSVVKFEDGCGGEMGGWMLGGILRMGKYEDLALTDEFLNITTRNELFLAVCSLCFKQTNENVVNYFFIYSQRQRGRCQVDEFMNCNYCKRVKVNVASIPSWF